MQPNPMVFVENPLQEHAASKVAIIEQQIELLEMITGCETKNRYHVFLQNPYGQKKFLFKCKEESGCCERNCCPSDARPFLMKVNHIRIKCKKIFRKFTQNLTGPSNAHASVSHDQV